MTSVWDLVTSVCGDECVGSGDECVGVVYPCKITQQKPCSRILPTFPHVENSCEINPSHMVFMIFNFVPCI